MIKIMTIHEFKPVEPLKSNRWLIDTYPTIIDPYLFRKYKLYNVSDEIVFETEFMETVQGVYNPNDLLEITDITVRYLDPIGETVSGLKMIVGGVNFQKKHSYNSDDLLITKLRFVIKQIEPLFVQTKGDETEKCVTCQGDTGEPKDLPVAFRKYYVEGAGQLCKNCYNSTYGKRNG